MGAGIIAEAASADAKKCEFLDDDADESNTTAHRSKSRTDGVSSLSWIFGETSFQPDDDIIPVYPMTNSHSPTGGQSIALPDIEIRDCWQPGMGLSDDEHLGRLCSPARRCMSGYTPLSEADPVTTTLERDDFRQFVQRQEIVKSLRFQADQPPSLVPGNSPVVVAQLSKPFQQQGPQPHKPKRKMIRRPKKETVMPENIPLSNEQGETQPVNKKRMASSVADGEKNPAVARLI